MMDKSRTADRAAEFLSQMGDEELIGVFREANSYGGSFEFADYCESLEDLVELAYGSPGWETPYDAICRVFFGDVHNLGFPVRLDAYHNVENVTEGQVAAECRECIVEMARYLAEEWENLNLPAGLEAALGEEDPE